MAADQAKTKQAVLSVLFLILVPFIVVESVGVALFAAIVHINSSLDGGATLVQLVAVSGVRALVLAVYARWGRPHHVLRINYRLTPLTVAAGVVAIPVGFLISNNFQIPSVYQPGVLREGHYMITHFGQALGVTTTIAQYVYYASAGILIVFLTDAFQALAEVQSLSQRAPWGGLGLALTWGLLHFSTKGFVVTIAAVVTGLILGGLYLLDRRGFWAPFALWMAITVV